MDPLTIMAVGKSIWDGLNFFGSRGRQKRAEELEAWQSKIQGQIQQNDLQGAIDQTGIAIQETQDEISLYEGFLARFGQSSLVSSGALPSPGVTTDKIDPRSRQMFDEVMSNYEMAGVIAGATGRSGAAGTSSAMIGEAAFTDLQANIDTTGRQLEIYNTSLDSLTKSKASMEQTLKELQNPPKQKKGGFWSDIGEGIADFFGG